jgi:nanoRNase/pAp phosphatase (c-di-AMP/oligoRNAs hydrolase)
VQWRRRDGPAQIEAALGLFERIQAKLTDAARACEQRTREIDAQIESLVMENERQEQARRKAARAIANISTLMGEHEDE